MNNTVGGASTTGAIGLVADSMQLNNIAVRSTSGTVGARTLTAARGIELGAGASDSATLGLLGTELANLTGAGGILIGDSANAFTGNISVVGAASVNSALQLWTKGGNIAVNAALTSTGAFNFDTNRGTGASTGSISGTGALSGTGASTFDAHQGISLTGANTLSNAGFTNRTSGAIAFNNTAATLSLGKTRQLSGGAISIVNTGNLSVPYGGANDDVEANGSGSGSVILKALGAGNTLTVNAGGHVHGANGIELHADNLTLLGSTINGGSIIKINPGTAGRAVDIG